MARLDREWHAQHPMPPKATLEQRIDWHLAHAANCGCRPIPAGVLAEMARRGLSAPPLRNPG